MLVPVFMSSTIKIFKRFHSSIKWRQLLAFAARSAAKYEKVHSSCWSAWNRTYCTRRITIKPLLWKNEEKVTHFIHIIYTLTILRDGELRIERLILTPCQWVQSNFARDYTEGREQGFTGGGDRAAWDWKVKIPSSNNIRGSLSSEKVFKIIVKDMSVSPIKYCLGLPREGSESETWSRQKMSNAMQNASFSVLWECSLCLD